MGIMSSGVPPIAFLGVVERAALVRDGNTNIFKYSLIGLKQIVLSHVFPLDIGLLHCALAIYTPHAGAQLRLRIKDETGTEAGTMDVAVTPLATPEAQN